MTERVEELALEPLDLTTYIKLLITLIFFDYAVGFGSGVGVGSTYFRRVTASVNTYDGIVGFGSSASFGKFSWGAITNFSRPDEQAFTAYLDNGVTGLLLDQESREYNHLNLPII